MDPPFDDVVPEPLERLCEVAGVVPRWVDAWGRPQVVAPDHLRAVLEALTGADLGTEKAIEAATLELLDDRPAVPPVVVAWDGVLPTIPCGTPVVDAVIELETGDEVVATTSRDAVFYGGVLPVGYHRLVVNAGDLVARIFSAPVRAHPWPSGKLGLIAPTYSLRRGDPDHGIGTLGDLRMLADLCERTGVDVVGTLPLLAAFDDQPSPYAPASRRAWNEVFVDVARIPGWDGAIRTPSTDPQWVDYDAAGSAIRSALADYARHVMSEPRLRSRVDAFLERDPEMRRYARFRALADTHGRNWRQWPTGVASDPARVNYHETVQWLMDDQLRSLSRDLAERGQYLYLDLPIGCHPDGYDIWDRPELFAPASLGAPPDTLFVGGQDWGLPASIPKRSREDGHANFRKAIARQLSVAGLLRIDHVMGIHRAWWVPHGAGAKEGAYVMQPTEEMFAIICIESVRAGVAIVGENLGTVPPEIREALDDHDLLGMSVGQDGTDDPRANDLVFLSSHDTPAFPAWWNGHDIEDLRDLGEFDDERAEAERRGRWDAIDSLQERFGTDGPVETRDALMEWMAGTNAAVALVNLDDLLMEERRQNVPGTDWERPNWRPRNLRTLEELAEDPAFTGRLRRFASLRADRAETPGPAPGPG